MAATVTFGVLGPNDEEIFTRVTPAVFDRSTGSLSRI